MRNNIKDVTLEHAKTIIRAGYPDMFNNLDEEWSFTDVDRRNILMNPYKIYSFGFFNDRIGIGCREKMFQYFDVRVECYLKADELGYYVTRLSDLLDDIEVPKVGNSDSIFEFFGYCDREAPMGEKGITLHPRLEPLNMRIKDFIEKKKS